MITPTKPQLFALDDSIEMQDMIRGAAQRVGWEVVPARSLEEARACCAKNGGNYDGALIDLMIPLTNANLEKVDPLLERRNTLSLEITKRARTDDDIQRRDAAKRELDDIDRLIMPLVADDGGIQFLQSETGKALAERVGGKLAIFSARRPNVKLGGNGDTLIDQCKSAIDRTEVEWFEKPVRVLDLEVWLREIIEPKILTGITA